MSLLIEEKRTVLEQLCNLKGNTIVEVCRKINVTPQQFNDWLKFRRPIPKDRLKQLSEYFEVEQGKIITEKNYAAELNEKSALELEKELLKKHIAKAKGTQAAGLKEEYRQLEKKEENQKRIKRLSVLLEKGNEDVLKRVDSLMEYLEKTIL